MKTENQMETPSQKQVQEKLQELDFTSLHTAAAISANIGFQHFQLFKDTRLNMEARKAHKFVADNCETITRKILEVTMLPPAEVEAVMRNIMRQIGQFHESQKVRASLAPVSEKLKQ